MFQEISAAHEETDTHCVTPTTDPCSTQLFSGSGVHLINEAPDNKERLAPENLLKGVNTNRDPHGALCSAAAGLPL